MVTKKRRIVSEQDRFGGYGMQPALKTAVDETETERLRDESFSFSIADEPGFITESRPAYQPERNAYVEKSDNGHSRADKVIEYSSRPYFGAYDFVKPVRAKKSRKHEKEDVMPSIRTRAYAKESVEEESSVTYGAKSKLSGKTKAMLIAYISVVLVLAVTVIATGLAASNINAQSSKLEYEISLKNAQLTEINAEIREYTNLDRIAGAASGNGMENIGSVTEIELVPPVDPVEYEGRTNWFDAVCDFVGKIFGG